MFKKTERLNRAEFSEFFRIGKRCHFPYLTIITSPFSTRKVSVVVGKKVAKSAVRRNLLKRRMSALLRGLLVENKHHGVFIIIIKPTFNSLSKKTADELSTQSIVQVLKSA